MVGVDEDYANAGDAQKTEWLGQSNLIYGGLIAVGLLMVQPFLTVDSLDLSAGVCVIAFAVAIPLLAALMLLNRQEVFRRRAADSRLVGVTKAAGQLSAIVGLVAGFWHISWVAGVALLAAGLVGVLVHAAGYVRLEHNSDGQPRD
jgi:hypothetical protein